MSKSWTLALGYVRYWGATVTVEAETLEEAIPAAIRLADDNERWKDTGHASDAYALAACTGADLDPWDGPVSALPIPDRFTECGFQSIPITHSSRFRSLIPFHSDHLFQSQPITDSSAIPITFGVGTGTVGGV